MINTKNHQQPRDDIRPGFRSLYQTSGQICCESSYILLGRRLKLFRAKDRVVSACGGKKDGKMINKSLLLTYLYLLIYITLSSGVILYNKVMLLNILELSGQHLHLFFSFFQLVCLNEFTHINPWISVHLTIKLRGGGLFPHLLFLIQLSKLLSRSHMF